MTMRKRTVRASEDLHCQVCAIDVPCADRGRMFPMRDVQNRQPVLNADRGFAIRQFMTRSLGVAAAATMMISLTPSARAVSLINPGAAPAAKQASDALLQVQHRGGRGGGGGG